MGRLPWETRGGERRITRTGQSGPVGRQRRTYNTKSRLPAPRFLTIVVILAVVLVVPLLIYQAVYADRINLGVKSMGVDVGGYSPAEAKTALSTAFGKFAQTDLILRYGGKEWRTSPGALGIRFDADATVKQAMQVGRTGGLFDQMGTRLSTLREGKAVLPVITFDAERQSAVIGNLASETDRPMVNASLLPKPDGTVEMVSSQVGRKLDGAATLRRVQESLGSISSGAIALVVVETPPRVLESQLIAARDSAERILSGPLTLVYQKESTKLDQKQLTAMLTFRQEGDKTIADLEDKSIQDIVVKMAERINRKPRDARFTFSGGKVQLVAESVDGQTVDVAASVQAVKDGALGATRIVPLVVNVTTPKVRSSDISSISVTDKLIEAATLYGDTGLDRQHNLKLAVSRLNGILIAPGETFSFNTALGPTTLADGYKMAWGIISTGTGHETVPSEAGGICQVSTTLFHAALWTGLRIDQRTEHIYWIPRYGKPPLGRTGLDSTVDGSGSADTLDFKFTNTTGNWLAIQGWVDGTNMYFALWGTKTGWSVQVLDPVVTNVVKTDPTVVRIEDKTIPLGQEVWVESAQDGFDSVVKRIVRQGDKIIDEYTVKSRYRTAQNVVRFNPAPTATPEAEQTPQANATVTGTPQPGSTPKPTTTTAPVATPVPTPTPKR
ncbi:MAG: VanW family protein [Chloroflexota bacterium]